MTCHEPTCATEVDSGLAYRCSECGNHFCAKHLAIFLGRRGQFCEDCSTTYAPA